MSNNTPVTFQISFHEQPYETCSNTMKNILNGISDGCLVESKDFPIEGKTNYYHGYPLEKVADLYGYQDKYLMLYQEETDLWYLYERKENDQISTLAYYAIVQDNEGTRWRILSVGKNPYQREAYENAYNDNERAALRRISPEVFGALGKPGVDDTDAFLSMMEYLPCLEERVIALYSRYWIRKNLYFHTPFVLIGPDDIFNDLRIIRSSRLPDKVKDELVMEKAKHADHAIILDRCNIYILPQMQNQSFKTHVELENDSNAKGVMNFNFDPKTIVQNVIILNKDILEDKKDIFNSKILFDQYLSVLENIFVINVHLEPIDTRKPAIRG